MIKLHKRSLLNPRNIAITNPKLLRNLPLRPLIPAIWILVAASSLIIVGSILGTSRFLNEVNDEKQTKNNFNNIDAQLVSREQIEEDELKKTALKEVDSRTAYDKFSSDFTAYKDMHAKHSAHYVNKQAKGNTISSKVLNEIEKKGELITYFENELASNSKTGEQLLNEFHIAIEKQNKEL